MALQKFAIAQRLGLLYKQSSLVATI